MALREQALYWEPLRWNRFRQERPLESFVLNFFDSHFEPVKRYLSARSPPSNPARQNSWAFGQPYPNKGLRAKGNEFAYSFSQRTESAADELCCALRSPRQELLAHLTQHPSNKKAVQIQFALSSYTQITSRCVRPAPICGSVAPPTPSSNQSSAQNWSPKYRPIAGRMINAAI